MKRDCGVARITVFPNKKRNVPCEFVYMNFNVTYADRVPPDVLTKDHPHDECEQQCDASNPKNQAPVAMLVRLGYAERTYEVTS